MMVAKNKGLGLLLTPALFVKVFTLLFSVTLGGMVRLLYHQQVDAGEIWLYLGLSMVFLILSVVYFLNFKLSGEN